MTTLSTDPKEVLKRAKKVLADLKAKDVKNQVDFDATTGEIWLEDVIASYGVNAKNIREALKAIGNRRVKLYINSPGGSVVEGLAICSVLREHAAGVDTVCIGQAASMASAVFMMGKTRTMAQGTLLMLHLPWTGLDQANSEDLLKEIQILQKHEASLIDIYASRSGMSAEEIKQILSAETWYTADEAVKAGLADKVSGQAAAKVTLTIAEAKRKLAQLDNQPLYGTVAWAKSKLAMCKAKQMLFELDMKEKYPSNVDITRSKLAKLKAERSRMQIDLLD